MIGSSITCPSGYVFDLPRTSAENTALDNAAGTNVVWLNFTDALSEGTFKRGTVLYMRWLEGEPSNLGNEDCTVMRSGDGEVGEVGDWIDVPCSDAHYFACRDPLFTTTCTSEACLNSLWAITSSVGPYSAMGSGSSVSCPSGYVFDRPRDALENEVLNTKMKSVGAGTVWLKMTDSFDEGVWSD